MPRVADLTVGIGAESSDFERGLGNATKDVRRFANETGKQFRNMSDDTTRSTRKTAREIARFRRNAIRDFRQLGRSIRNIAAGFTAAFGALVITQSQYAQEVLRTARATGQAAGNIQVIRLALQSLGKDGESVNDLLIDWADRLQELRDGTASFVMDFALLGLAAEDFANIPIDEQIIKVSRAVCGNPKTTLRDWLRRRVCFRNSKRS